MNTASISSTAAAVDAAGARARTMTFAGGAAAAVVTIGSLVLIGWAADIEPLKSIIPGFIVMLPLTATAFICAGAALWLLRDDAHAARNLYVARMLCGIAFAIGFLSFVERVFRIQIGLDLLLFADELHNYPYRPVGQMASNSGLCFTLGTVALYLLTLEPRRSAVWREAFAVGALSISGLALLGYLYGATPLYTFDRFAGMALLTAVSFTTLNLGILFARPDRGYVTLVTRADAIGRLTRRLLVATSTVPIAGGWVWLQARNAELFSREGGLAILIAFTMFALAGVVLQSSALLRRTDQQREALLDRERDLRALAEHAQAEAERANRAKSDFLATMSHELRTPLNAVIGYASLMEEGVTGSISSMQQRHVSRIKLSAQHLLALIDQILGISRLEAGKERIILRTVHVPDLIVETSVIAEPLFRDKSARFVVGNAPAVTLTTDPDRVRQILLNLLSNAVKFCEKGDISLRVTHDAVTREVHFDVVDTGIGIETEHLEKIFEPFWQVEMNTTRKHQGAGLGLSLSRQLARALGGDLTVRSTKGVGSTFRLVLPAASA